MGKTTSPNSCESPDRLFRECVTRAATASRFTMAAMRNRDRVRRELYRVAAAFQLLTRGHHAWLLGQAERVGGIETLLDGWFRSLAQFGEDYRELLRDVSEGMTEKQYLASTAGSFCRRKRVDDLVRRPRADLGPPPQIDPTLPVDQRVALLDDENRSLRQQLKTERKENNEFRRIVARQEKRIEELESKLNQVEKVVRRKSA